MNLTARTRGHLALMGYRIEQALGVTLPSFAHLRDTEVPLVHLGVAAALAGEDLTVVEEGIPSWQPPPEFTERLGLALVRVGCQG